MELLSLYNIRKATMISVCLTSTSLSKTCKRPPVMVFNPSHLAGDYLETKQNAFSNSSFFVFLALLPGKHFTKNLEIIQPAR